MSRGSTFFFVGRNARDQTRRDDRQTARERERSHPQPPARTAPTLSLSMPCHAVPWGDGSCPMTLPERVSMVEPYDAISAVPGSESSWVGDAPAEGPDIRPLGWLDGCMAIT